MILLIIQIKEAIRKRILVLLVVLAVITTGVFANAQKEQGADKVVTINFSSVSVPGDAHTEAMTVFKDELEKLSKGTIKVNVYPSGQFFDQEGEQAAIRQGSVDMIYTSAPWLAEFVPYLSMFTAVYTFQGV